MFPHTKNRKLNVAFVFILFVSLSLACGLGIPGLGRGDATPTVDLDGAATPPAGEEEAATLDESASGGDTAEATPESSPETKPAQESSGLADLDSDQIFFLPGDEPPTMDPHLSGDATSAEYVVEIFSGLLAYDRELNLIPDIAESYDISADGLVYTFKIRPEAVFQDGRPIRAEDFKWSLERACDPATGSPTADTYLGDIVGCRDRLQGRAKTVEGVQVIDDLTLQLTIDEPKGFFLAKMTYPTAYVLDRDNVESGPDWSTRPNGSGPFKLETYAPQEGAIILTKNDNFYRDPRPVLERIVYVVGNPINPMTGYEQDLNPLGLPGVTFNAIEVGTANLNAATDPNNPLSKELVSVDALSVNYVGFNVKPPPFDDVKVRQAFNLALDKRRMVKVVFQDTVPVANGIVPPGMPGYQNPDLSDYEYDPERALELLAESSYGDASELPDITLHVSGSGGEVGPIVEAMIESYKQNLGVEINVEQVPWPQFLADLNNPDNDYQMYQLGWIADYPDPQNFLEVLFHSASTQNHGHYRNLKVDALLDQARGTPEEGERLALYRQAEQLILDDAAWIPLYFSVDNWLVKPYVQNFTIPPIKIPKFQYVSIAEH
ncbi:MAG: peptide ABC transporter substrate-binding protein [Chloroflexota bacterium]